MIALLRKLRDSRPRHIRTLAATPATALALQERKLITIDRGPGAAFHSALATPGHYILQLTRKGDTWLTANPPPEEREAPLVCGARCVAHIRNNTLASPCGVDGCECYCNR